MYFKKYLYNVTKKDKRNVFVFVEAVAIIMFTPITLREQLPCTRVEAFSQIRLFLERSWL